MKDGQEGVSDRIQMFRADRRKNCEPDTFICGLGMANIIRPAIHRHIMAPGGQTGAELFGKRLESSVICRNTAGTEDGQFHGVAIIDYAFLSCRSGSRFAGSNFPKR